METAVANRIDRIKHDTRHRPLQILCVRVLRTQQTLDEREEAAEPVRADFIPAEGFAGAKAGSKLRKAQARGQGLCLLSPAS